MYRQQEKLKRSDTRGGRGGVGGQSFNLCMPLTNAHARSNIIYSRQLNFFRNLMINGNLNLKYSGICIVRISSVDLFNNKKFILKCQRIS